MRIHQRVATAADHQGAIMNDPETTARTTKEGVDRTGAWVLDRALSSVRFAHKTLWGMATVKGEFAEVSGKGEAAEGGRTAVGTVVIRVASVDTSHSRRDGHLRSAMFFDAEKYPEIAFDAEQVEFCAEETVRITGRLMVKDREKALDFTAKAVETDPGTLRLTATVTLDRAEFGLTKNQLGMIKGPATVSADLLFRRLLD